MEQRSDGEFYFGNPVLTYFGHYEGIMGSLQVDHSDGYATVGYKMEPKYFITGGYGEQSGFIDKIKMKIERDLNANSLIHISDENASSCKISSLEHELSQAHSPQTATTIIMIIYVYNFMWIQQLE